LLVEQSKRIATNASTATIRIFIDVMLASCGQIDGHRRAAYGSKTLSWWKFDVTDSPTMAQPGHRASHSLC